MLCDVLCGNYKEIYFNNKKISKFAPAIKVSHYNEN